MKNLWYYIFFYLAVYLPIIGGSFRKYNVLLYLLLAIIIIFHYKNLSLNLFRQSRPIWMSIIYLIIYVMINVAVNNADPIILHATFSMTIIPFFMLVSLLTLFKAKGRQDFISDFIKVATTASVISIFLYSVPQLGKSVLFLLAGDDTNSIQRFYDEGRGYGIAGSLFYGYSITQAIAAFLCIRTNKLSGYFCALLMLLSIILNARIGLFVFIALLLINYAVLSPIRRTVKAVVSILLIIGVTICTGVYKEFQDNLDWTLESIYLVSDFMFGTNLGSGYGHFEALAGSFLIWPNNLAEWLFGSGVYLFYGVGSYSSDVGFILQLNWGGLLYVLLLLLPVWIVLKGFIKYKRWDFVIIVLTTLIICNWKGDIFTQSNFLFIITALFLLSGHKNENYISNYRGL